MEIKISKVKQNIFLFVFTFIIAGGLLLGIMMTAKKIIQHVLTLLSERGSGNVCCLQNKVFRRGKVLKKAGLHFRRQMLPIQRITTLENLIHVRMFGLVKNIPRGNSKKQKLVKLITKKTIQAHLIKNTENASTIRSKAFLNSEKSRGDMVTYFLGRSM